MTITKSKFARVIKFYQSLPIELISGIINKIGDANRKSQRMLSKYKTIEDKIKFLLQPSTREIFCDIAYGIIKSKVNLTLENTEYDEIISNITDDNKNYYTIFFFRWCYENGRDGISNDTKYFEKFINSELFDKILYGLPLKNGNTDVLIKNQLTSTLSMDTIKDETVTSEVTDYVLRQTDINLTGDVKKMKLLGYIEKRNTFYNFFPKFKFEDGKFKEISSVELEKEYPTNGAINLGITAFASLSRSFLEKINTDESEDKYVKNAYIVDIDNYYLEENDNPTYRVKMDLQGLVQKGKDIESIIKSANNYNIYKVVTSESGEILDDTFINDNIYLKEQNIVKNERVMLYEGSKYYGPFIVAYRAIDGKYYVKTNAAEKNYLVRYYSENDVQRIELEKKAYFEAATYSEFVYVYGEHLTYDAITDEILLKKIPNEISLEMARDNPEEFSHLYNNSPFVAKVPQTVIKNRIKRLQEIVKNVEILEEKKYEVFEMLLPFCKDKSSKELKEMIESSDLYKDLYERYNEERRKNVDAEKLIQDLKKQLIDQNSKLEEKSNSIATSERIKQLQEENEKLKENAKLSENVDKLKEEINQLEYYERRLNERIISLSSQEKSISSTIHDAINNESKKMAKLAFDPYISSEMMKAAASWDDEENKNYYSECQTKLRTINPSSLSGSDLIDYIEKYVKDRRDYSKNEIVNIYICIAQNFFTIFSGEPGTGKTSMCNIISETLGLMNYGENLNRFVSVSVERGWTSKRDLIGYFNPLTRKYDKSNKKIYDALKTLDIERENSKYPYLILLDEANLSPIEYYWSDFMRLTDRSSENDAYINIGTEEEIFIPETLRFVATINTDQTTETLSPRLVDRACIIKLPKGNLKEQPHENSDIQIVTWNNFIETFTQNEELNSVTEKAIKDIYKLFNDYGMTVSQRIQNGIRKYVKTAQCIMENEADVLAREKALDFAIVQKLLPKINGYYSVYERFFDSLRQICKEYHLKMTEEAITNIIDSQERNMGYCQYLI